MALSEAERKKMEAESEARLKAREQGKDPYGGQANPDLPKHLLGDNYPEKKPGKKSPKNGQNLKHPPNRTNPPTNTTKPHGKSDIFGRKKKIDDAEKKATGGK
jgi:hypothetical protein